MKRHFVILLVAFILTGLLSFSTMSLAQGGQWKKVADIPTARHNFATAVVNNLIYAIGGWDGGDWLSSVEVYNPAADKWKKAADIPTKRRFFATAVVGGKIYTFGGQTQIERRGRKVAKTVTAIEVYDPATGAWEKIGDAPQPRTYMSTVALNGKVYVIGGERPTPGGGFIVEAFDPAQNAWAEVAKLNETRFGQTAATVNGKVYVIGGFRKENVWLKTVEEYDPATDTWQNKKDMPTGRNELPPTTPVVNGRIYVIGGSGNDDKPLATVEEYDPAKDEWKKMVSMPTARRALSVAAVQWKLYAIGGTAQDFKLFLPECCDLQPFATVEEFTPPGWPFAVSPQGKLATTWGHLKATQ